MSHPTPFTHDELRASTTVHHAVHRMARFHDVDAALTVFFPKYFEFASDAVMELLLERGVDVPGMLRDKKGYAPLVHVEADYAAPLRFGDRFVLEVVALHAGGSSYAFGCRLRTEDGRPLATLMMVHVYLDGATGRPAPLPEGLRCALTT